MAEKTYLFKGLEVRSNQLEREGNTARDCSNVRLDQNNRLIKREEFSNLNIVFGLTDTILDIVSFKGKLIILTLFTDVDTPFDAFNRVYSYDVDTSSLTEIINNSAEYWKYEISKSFPAIYPRIKTFTGKVSSFEKNDCLYFISDENNTNIGFEGMAGTPEVIKYDGLHWYMSGVGYLNPISEAEDVGTKAGSDYYLRYIPFYIDNEGNQILGRSVVQDVVAVGTIVNPGYLPPNLNPYIFSQSTANFQVQGTINTSNVGTIVLPVYNNWCVVGQHVVSITNRAPMTLQPEVRRYKIISINPGVSVEVGEMSFYDIDTQSWIPDNVTRVDIRDGEVMSGTGIGIYISREYSVGYTYLGFRGYTTDSTPNAVGGMDVAAPYVLPEQIILTEFLEDCYGDDIKFNPPAGIQIREYGEACILIDDKYLYFSDLSINGTVENFLAFDSILVGEEEKGRNTAFFSNETFIGLFRENDSYMIIGNLFTGNYRIQSARSTGIGCTSPLSILEIEGQCLFMSNKGPAILTENSSVVPIGDPIEPILTSNLLGINPNLNKCKSTLDTPKEIIYIVVPSNTAATLDIVLLYDYRNKQWFKYSDLNMRGGLALHSDGLLYYSDGSDVYVEQPLNTYTSGVDAYWRSNFETLGKASMKKRFQRLHLFLTSFLSTDILFKAYSDWNTVDAYTDQTITPSPTIPMDNKRCNPKLVYSNSFDIESTGTNILSVDGFEYSFEVEQQGLNDDVRQ